MDPHAIREKFGGDFIADERTFVMGIDRRFTTHFAERFIGLKVLETCTGAGFTTISLAETAAHVVTIEINRSNQEQAIRNIETAGCASNVSFVHGSILDPDILKRLSPVDAAFIDPDWAVTGPDHVYRFTGSNTRPPADMVLNHIFNITGHIAVVLPPFIDVKEFDHLPLHERESLYLGDSIELFCLYFGKLMKYPGNTHFRVKV